jgi:hypothetical protein
MLVWPEAPGVTVVPGIRLARAGTLRVAVGIESSMALLTTKVCRLPTTSTTGDSAATVTVSLRSPSSRATLIGAAKLPSRTIPVRRTVRNPLRAKLTS